MEQKLVYEQFVRLLHSLGLKKCQLVARHAAEEAEDKLLLQDYSGVDSVFHGIASTIPTNTTTQQSDAPEATSTQDVNLQT